MARAPSKFRLPAGAVRWAATLGLVATFSVAQTSTAPVEVQVTAAAIPDNEYDSGRNGIPCPACNFGDGNRRFVLSDSQYNLYVSKVDAATGQFVPPDGHGLLLETSAAPPTEFGNGPEWFESSQGSGFVYTHHIPGSPPSEDNAVVGIGQMVDGVWTLTYLPGTNRVSPDATKNANDPDVYINYVSSPKGKWYWRRLSELGVEHEFPPEIEALTTGNERRWVPGTHSIIFQGHREGVDPLLVDQAFLYDVDTGALEQLTNNPAGIVGVFMWHAPEFKGELVFLTFSKFRQKILVHRKLPGLDGVKRWTVIKTVKGPDELPFFFSAEPFTHNGHSYIFTEISSSSRFFDRTIPNHIAMTGVNPLTIDARLLTKPDSVFRLRLDPEYFITDQGPFIYYNRLVPETDNNEAFNDGVWRVDTGLGPAKKETPQ